MKIFDFFRDTKGELKHVSWPTQKQSLAFSLAVILISLITAVLLGFFDFLISTGLDKFVI